MTTTTMSVDASDSGPTGARAVDRATHLLAAIVSASEPMAFTRLVDLTGLPKSTVSRLLSSLERGGLVSRTADGAAVPGPVITAYARSRSPYDDLRLSARPALERLGDATGETINLAVPTPSGVAQIDQVDPRFLLGAVNWVDREVPYHASALGKALLAAGYPLPPGRLRRLTAHTLTTRSDLEADLRATRERGYAITNGELEPGLVAVAAAITIDNQPVAALSVSGPETRLTREHARRIGAMLVSEAHALSALLSRPHPGLPSPGKAGAA